jgi:hypothetical protein
VLLCTALHAFLVFAAFVSATRGPEARYSFYWDTFFSERRWAQIKNLKLGGNLGAGHVSDRLIGNPLLLGSLPNFQRCVWLHRPPPDWISTNSDARPALG